MGFVSERFFLYADIDACENFPYVNAFETARKGKKKIRLVQTIRNVVLNNFLCFYKYKYKKKKKKTCLSFFHPEWRSIIQIIVAEL